jgi:chromosomal replication initiation ATPase DnaA
MRSPPTRSRSQCRPARLSAAAAAAALQVDPTFLDAPTRQRAPIARARQLAVYLHHVAMGASLSDCARQFGRDRATVRHACARIEDRRDDPAFDAAAARLAAALVAQCEMLGALSSAANPAEATP